MDTGSFNVFGGAAKTSYDTYSFLTSYKSYDVDIFADISMIDNHVKSVKEDSFKKDYYDVILLNSIRDVPVVMKYFNPGKSKTSFIYTDRGNVLPNMKNAGTKGFLPKMMARSYYISKMKSWLNCYVALSAEQAQLAKEFFGKKTTITFIPNWYSKEFTRLKNIGRSWSALYVGRLDERQKKVSFLIDGIKRFTQNKKVLHGGEVLWIVGTGPDEESYKRQARMLGIGDKIKFFGFVDSKELISLYNSAAFFVSASEWEGMSGTFVEAMACGLPLLINEGNNTVIENSPKKMLVTGESNGLVYKYGDMTDFVSKFEKLYSDKDYREKLGQNSLQLSKKFEMDANLAKYRKLIEQL